MDAAFLAIILLKLIRLVAIMPSKFNKGDFDQLGDELEKKIEKEREHRASKYSSPKSEVHKEILIDEDMDRIRKGLEPELFGFAFELSNEKTSFDKKCKTDMKTFWALAKPVINHVIVKRLEAK